MRIAFDTGFVYRIIGITTTIAVLDSFCDCGLGCLKQTSMIFEVSEARALHEPVWDPHRSIQTQSVNIPSTLYLGNSFTYKKNKNYYSYYDIRDTVSTAISAPQKGLERTSVTPHGAEESFRDPSNEPEGYKTIIRR